MRYKKSVSFSQVMPVLLAIFCLCPRIVNCQNLTINNQLGAFKDTATFKVSIKMATNSVQSFGFDLRFDPQILEYVGYQRGKMMEEYDFMDCIQIRPGVLRCGGFDKGGNSILVGQTGAVLILNFQKIMCKNCVLNFEGLTDDLKNWYSGVGRFFCLGR